MKKFTFKILLLVFSTLISLLILEGALRLITSPNYYIWKPNLKQVFTPDSSIIQGVSDTAYFLTNSLGLRGEEYNGNINSHIITLGGSTTECLYLDQQHSWPSLLQNTINKNNLICQVFDGGKSGLTSIHILRQLTILLRQNPEFDTYIVMAGLNDMIQSSVLGNGVTSYNPETDTRAFDISPLDKNIPIVKRSYIYKYLAKLYREFSSIKLSQDAKGEVYSRWRKNRQTAKEIIDTIPLHFETALEKYSENISDIIALVKKEKKRIIFITQPVLWSDSISHRSNAQCWMGWLKGNQYNNDGRYYSIPVLTRMMEKYNQRTLEVCTKTNMPIYDLASVMGADTSVFYDDCHFNDTGARKMSNAIADFVFNNITISIKKTSVISIQNRYKFCI